RDVPHSRGLRARFSAGEDTGWSRAGVARKLATAGFQPEMRRQAISAMLKGGDRRSIGKSNQIAQLVLSEPKRFAELVESLWDEDPIVRMRAADAAEKVAVTRPEFLNPHKRELLGLLDEAEQI